MQISDLAIEVTRKCNMQCSHCLRGDIQNLEISDNILESFFSKIRDSYINTVTITGGEPSLVPKRIMKIVEKAKKHNVKFGAFYTVTNAKSIPDDFILAICKIYCYCEEKENCSVNYSNDYFHEEEYKDKEKLEVFKFFSPKSREDNEYYDPISEGRGKDYNSSDRNRNLSQYEIQDDWIGESIIYLNCKGNILPDCNLSYETQDDKNLILGNVKDKDFNLLDCAKKWNEELDKIGKDYLSNKEE